MNVFVWGVGCGAGDLMDSALHPELVTAFVSESDETPDFLGRPVIRPEDPQLREADRILVTVRDADGVQARCRALGIAEEKLFFLKNDAVLVSRSGAADAARAVLGEEKLESLRGTERLIRRPLWTERETLPEKDLAGDYVRVKTLELLCRQISHVPGAAAELGVYRGDFARCMNALLPERTLYLFDTFEGFDMRESEGEGEGFRQAHGRTAEKRVLEAMPHPEAVMVRKGLFPATAEGLEGEHFALVSLDVDLEESTLAGLRFFLPRLSPGGYLLLHDCLSPKLPGVERALRRYEAACGQRLHMVPLCDINGTMVIAG